jgi:hypothetical protein
MALDTVFSETEGCVSATCLTMSKWHAGGQGSHFAGVCRV